MGYMDKFMEVQIQDRLTWKILRRFRDTFIMINGRFYACSDTGLSSMDELVEIHD